MIAVALWEPEVPPNTGNIARLCAATGSPLHLIGKLGFHITDKALKRAGLDYWSAVEVIQHKSFEDFLHVVPANLIWAIDNPAPIRYTQCQYTIDDCLLFGSETRGLPADLRERFVHRLIGIPMPSGKVRSLNLATSVGIVLYEALRQLEAD